MNTKPDTRNMYVFGSLEKLQQINVSVNVDGVDETHHPREEAPSQAEPIQPQKEGFQSESEEERFQKMAPQSKREEVQPQEEVIQPRVVKRQYASPTEELFKLNLRTVSLDEVRELLEQGAYPNAKFPGMIGMLSSPIHAAVQCNRPDIVKLLIEYGADYNEKESDGKTPLHWACYRNYTEVVEVLINSGADVRARTDVGTTPLHLVRSAEAARLLLENGANPNVVDRWGKTPYSIARQRRDTNVMKVLEPVTFSLGLCIARLLFGERHHFR